MHCFFFAVPTFLSKRTISITYINCVCVGWEHVFVADSLAMGEAAVEMAKKGVKNFAVLGVDFMSESVKATLKQQGFSDVHVYRLK